MKTTMILLSTIFILQINLIAQDLYVSQSNWNWEYYQDTLVVQYSFFNSSNSGNSVMQDFHVGVAFKEVNTQATGHIDSVGNSPNSGMKLYNAELGLQLPLNPGSGYDMTYKVHLPSTNLPDGEWQPIVAVDNYLAIQETDEFNNALILCVSGLPCETIELNRNSVSLNDSEELNKKIKLYPNPSKGNLNIEFEEIPISAGIYNFSGVLVKNFEINKLLTAYNINLSNLKKGVYYIRMYTESGVASKRFILK